MKNKKVLIGLSGGINSAAVLCNLVECGQKPKELHLFAVDLVEHSPDTLFFVEALIIYAKANFKNIFVKINRDSVLRYFEANKMIPHPIQSPCSRELKIEPINKYIEQHKIDLDLIGYVKHELKRRVSRQKASNKSLIKTYPIGEFSDEWCFEIVKKHVGWYPKIYDIRDENGKRVFKHNNCLPCKNMSIKDMELVKKHFPEYHARAMETSKKLMKYWGRDEAIFYSTFGRDLGQDSTCETCKI